MGGVWKLSGSRRKGAGVLHDKENDNNNDNMYTTPQGHLGGKQHGGGGVGGGRRVLHDDDEAYMTTQGRPGLQQRSAPKNENLSNHPCPGWMLNASSKFIQNLGFCQIFLSSVLRLILFLRHSGAVTIAEVSKLKFVSANYLAGSEMSHL